MIPLSKRQVSNPLEWEHQKAWFKTIGYEWWSPEAELIHRDTHKTLLISGGEQAGKSHTTFMEGAYRICFEGFSSPPELPEKREYWLLGADYDKTSVEFEGLIDIFTKLHLKIKIVNETDSANKRSLHVKFTNDPLEPITKIITKSGKYPESSLSQVGPKGIIGCEMSQCALEAYRRCIGRMAPRDAWFIMSGTFEKSLGWYIELFKRWQVNNSDNAKSYKLPSWSNLILYPGGENDPKIVDAKSKLDKDFFDMRFGGEPTVPRGAVFGGVFSTLIHVNEDIAKFEPEDDVMITVDPGWGHANVVYVIQQRHGLVLLIDELYLTGLYTPGEHGIIGEFERMRNPETGLFYYDSMQSRRGYCDVDGKKHTAIGPPVVQAWRDELGIELDCNKIVVHDGIDMLKRFLQPHLVTGKAMLYVHPRCKGFIAECGHGPNPLTNEPSIYTWKTNDIGNNVGLEPIKLNDDCVKAVWYFLCGEFGPSDPNRRYKSKVMCRSNVPVLV